jgi:hypothetical protein
VSEGLRESISVCLYVCLLAPASFGVYIFTSARARVCVCVCVRAHAHGISRLLRRIMSPSSCRNNATPSSKRRWSGCNEPRVHAFFPAAERHPVFFHDSLMFFLF